MYEMMTENSSNANEIESLFEMLLETPRNSEAENVMLKVCRELVPVLECMKCILIEKNGMQTYKPIHR